MKFNWKKLHFAFILLSLSPSVVETVSGEEDSNGVRERSNSVSFAVTLHRADTAVITQNLNPTEDELELSQLREEILDLHRRKETLERKYYGLQMRIAGLFGNDITVQDSKVKEDLLSGPYGALLEAGSEMAWRSNRLVALLDAVFEVGLPRDATQLLRLRQDVEALQNSTAKVIDLVSPIGRNPEDNDRILDVNPGLQLVAISAGYNQGIRSGMVVWVKQNALKNEDEATMIKLRIIEVRPDISAAILLQGDWRKLVPGMAVTAGRMNKQQ